MRPNHYLNSKKNRVDIGRGIQIYLATLLIILGVMIWFAEK